MNTDWRSPRARRILLTLGFGLILLGIAIIYVSILPTEGTVTYNGPMNDSIVIGKIPSRIGWTGGGYLSADFNMTGGTHGNPLVLTFVSESDAVGGVWSNGSVFWKMPMGQSVNIELAFEQGGSGDISARVHWRVDGMNPLWLVPGMVSLVAGITVAVMGRKKKENLVSRAEFESSVKP